MQVKDEPSPAAAARRAQIVTAAIEVLADLGYARTSFARIAERAGISSTRLISYHFAGKDDLMRAVAAEVLGEAEAFMSPRIRAATGHWNMLRAYIASNLEFLRDHPAHLRALTEVIANLRAEDGSLAAGAPGAPDAVARLADGLRAGQRDGAFRDFDAGVMARTLRAAIDAAAGLYSADPGLDLDHYAAELVSLFGLAVLGREPGEGEPA
ncbi:TetR/AcrR family transcriptional regulator [Actinomadura rupiterrae]|uniref:TetR/AcrR family transcriptional regulator n=1 Tax=Actinomadura rupiterrae TaxID=559627 RepID=UPI0020A4596C|nr:TetR/AcrR family transcriptional regulator [Actinomadura rupiterrae]MCP2341358.1 AcrR family transcriptional regulator [Actinomadura rupiterrae]